MTSLINFFPRDIWIEIFTFLGRDIDNAAKTCKDFKAYAENPKVQQFVTRHPFEAFARFYISNIDAQAILDKFHQLDPVDQASIKQEIWRIAGYNKREGWVNDTVQSNIKHPAIFRTIIAIGKLGLRLSALEEFQKAVDDLSLTSECITNALTKLSRVPWTNAADPLQIGHNEIPLKEDNAAEAVKYFVWENCENPTYDSDFGLHFLQENPHADEVKKAVSDARLKAIRKFKFYNEFIADERLNSLVEHYQLDHFIKLHDQSDDIDAILCQFHNLDPTYQKLIKIKIWETGGKQMLQLGDWAEQELKTNIQGDTVQRVKEQLKNLPFKLTPETALCSLAIRALNEFKECINDTSKSSDDVMHALQKLEVEYYRQGWDVAEIWNIADLFKYFIFCELSTGSECRTEEKKQFMMQQASDFIRENPHHECLNENLNIILEIVEDLFQKAAQKKA